MPNAIDKKADTKPTVLALGLPGAGKTSQILTLPGRKFAYLFDPQAINTLMGYDIEYKEFLPDKLSLRLTSLSENVRKREGLNPNRNHGREVYEAWEKDFETKAESGFFDDFDVICFDSFTTLSDMVMDGVLAVNGRGGQWPQQDDYGPQMLTLSNIMRTATSLNKLIYVTGHIEMKQDEASKRMMMTPLMTGRLKTKLPILFSELLSFEAAADMKGNISWVVQTRPDRLTPIARTSMKHVSFKEDVTIDWTKDPEGQGLAALMRKGGIL